jgi:hypothetical protein
MKRREFISFRQRRVLALASRGQQPKRVARIGFLIEPTAGDNVRMR